MSPEAFVDGRDQSQWIDPLGKRAAELQSIKYVVDSAVASSHGRNQGRRGDLLSHFTIFCIFLKR